MAIPPLDAPQGGVDGGNQEGRYLSARDAAVGARSLLRQNDLGVVQAARRRSGSSSVATRAYTATLAITAPNNAPDTWPRPTFAP